MRYVTEHPKLPESITSLPHKSVLELLRHKAKQTETYQTNLTAKSVILLQLLADTPELLSTEGSVEAALPYSQKQIMDALEAKKKLLDLAHGDSDKIDEARHAQEVALQYDPIVDACEDVVLTHPDIFFPKINDLCVEFIALTDRTPDDGTITPDYRTYLPGFGGDAKELRLLQNRIAIAEKIADLHRENGAAYDRMEQAKRDSTTKTNQ